MAKKAGAGSASPGFETKALLDLPLALSYPQGVRFYISRLKPRFRGFRPFRHSRLDAEHRWLDSLVTFRTERIDKWMDALATPYSQTSLEAKPGRRLTRLGKKKIWPYGYGAYDTRRSLLLFDGTSARVSVQIPQKSILLFDLGLIGDGRGMLPIVFTVRARRTDTDKATDKATAEPIFEHHMGTAQTGRWESFSVSMEKYANASVELVFEAKVNGRRGEAMGSVALANPSLLLTSMPVSKALPNVLLIVLDTARPDALGCYGQKRVATPIIDGLAKKGTILLNAFTNAVWTRPSLMTMFSGRTPGRAGSTPGNFGSSQWDREYIHKAGGPTLFSWLKAHGYMNRGILNDVFMLPFPGVGHDHGLDSFVHIQAGSGPRRKDNEAISRGVEAFLKHHQDRRFFLYVLYESLHGPYQPPAEAQDKYRFLSGMKPRAGLSMIDKYRAEVMVLDRHVGRVLDALKKHGLADRTIVVITSDHGETLSLHHCYMLPRMGYSTCYKHSASLYEEVLRVPLIISGPSIPSGIKATQTYRHEDLAATLLDLLGLPSLPGSTGVSVLPQIQGRKPDEPRDVYAVGRGVFTLRRGRYKYVYREGRAQEIVQGQRRRVVAAELFDLERDPEEKRNLVFKLPRVSAEMKEALKKKMEQDRIPREFRYNPRRGKRGLPRK